MTCLVLFVVCIETLSSNAESITTTPKEELEKRQGSLPYDKDNTPTHTHTHFLLLQQAYSQNIK